MQTVGFIFGTRPEVIKMAPVILKAKQEGFKTCVVFTGQHKEMAYEILEFLNISIDIELDIMEKSSNLSSLSANMLFEMEPHLEAIKKCKYIFVQGDTTSAFIGSYFCFLHSIKVCHIEAGLRTYNLDSPFPEEANRQLIGRIASFHFAPTNKSYKALIDEGVASTNVAMVGNTVLDTLQIVSSLLEKNYHTTYLKHGLDADKEIILVTSHRRENFGDGLNNICDALILLANKYPQFNFVFPVHLNPKVDKVVREKLKGRESIKLLRPLSYLDFVALLSRAKVVISDSGGVQEEAPSFSKPVIVLRETTERTEAVECGFARLCGTDIVKIEQAFDFYLSHPIDKNIANPFGDAQSSQRIINFIKGLEG